MSAELSQPDFDADGTAATCTVSGGQRSYRAAYLKKQARWGMKHAAAFLSLGLFLEIGATFWTLAQAIASGVFDEADCGVRALSLYHNDRLPSNCEQLDSSSVWFDEDRTVSTFTSCSGLEDPAIDQLCDCAKYNRVRTGCTWTPASSTRDEIEGLCVAVPVIALTADLQEEYGTTYDWLLDSSELEYQDDCTPLSPEGFGDITIALLVVSLSLELVEAYVGYKRWRDPLSVRGLVVVASVLEGVGLFSIWCLLRFLPGGILETEVSENQYKFLNIMLYGVLVATFGGTLAEVVFYFSAPGRFRYLGVFGNSLTWLASGLTDVVVTAYLVWRLQWWENAGDETADEETWPVLVAAVIGLVVLEVAALLVLWIARVLIARARSALLTAKDLSLKEPCSGVANGSGAASHKEI
ncbi:unnamed protein product [Ectocarpus sp. 4 AP-2014]